jgi:L-ascorbate metabolism protein UlaG (beta-lactamase superfamily)
LEITYLGRSTFRLRGKEVTVVTDPDASGDAPARLQADIVTASRPGSADVPAAGVTRQVHGPGEYEVADILIHGVATRAEPEVGPSNTAYVFRIDDLVLCHLGALSNKLDAYQIEEIGNIDVVFIPTGNGEKLEPADAAEVVHQLDPKLVIPMELDGNGDGAMPETFLREMGATAVTPEPKLSVTRGSLPAEVRVVVLEPKRG